MESTCLEQRKCRTRPSFQKHYADDLYVAIMTRVNPEYPIEPWKETAGHYPFDKKGRHHQPNDDHDSPVSHDCPRARGSQLRGA
jgi:hypothetical protein